MALDPHVEAIVATVRDEIEPLIRETADSFYERLLGSVHEYLVDNIAFNIGSQLSAARAQALSDRNKLFEEQKISAALVIALQALAPILATAESNASGNPEWGDVSARINAARTAVAKANGA